MEESKVLGKVESVNNSGNERSPVSGKGGARSQENPFASQHYLETIPLLINDFIALLFAS